MDTTNMTITDKTTADLSGTISFPGSIINTTPNPYIGMASTIGVASAMANSVGTTVTNLKNELEQRDIFNGEETLDFNVYFNIERVDEEITDYSLVIDTPKINMHNVKALLIHNFVNEEAYPSVGIFDSPKELQENSKDKIVLNGHIQTINDISNTKFKLYLEYTDDNNDLNKIYYEVNRG